MANPIQKTTEAEQAEMHKRIPISGSTGLASWGDARVMKDLESGYVPFEEQDLESDVLDDAKDKENTK